MTYSTPFSDDVRIVHPHDIGVPRQDAGLPVVDLTVYLAALKDVEVVECGLEIAVGPTRVIICSADLAPTAGEVDAFERFTDAVLEVRTALRDAYRDGAR